MDGVASRENGPDGRPKIDPAVSSRIEGAPDVTFDPSEEEAGGPAPSSPCRGDVNANEVVDVNDVFALINYLFAGGPAPPP